jgi:hypothetical protein
MRLMPEANSWLSSFILPRLADPAARRLLVAELGKHPPWRGNAWSYLARKLDFGALDDLRRTLVDPHGDAGTTSLDGAELRAYLARAVAEHRYAVAAAAWEASLTRLQRAARRPVVNGDFEAVPAAPPFDWQIDPVDGVEAGIVALPDAVGHALRVEFYGKRAAFAHVRQLLVLRPGDYRLEWRARMEGFDTARGLHWVVDCADRTDAPLGSSELMNGTTPWRAHRLVFRVPDDCPAEWLTLALDARIAAETQAYGSAWFDDITLTPVGSPATAESQP